MTFIHPYLLLGLLLAGVPVLLHLIMRQKPRKLRFPAFRFLKQRYRVNQRKLNLQHLLLLLLRVAVVVALCLALARPRLFAGRVFSSSDRPATVVFLLDTSPSMEYTAGGVSRLDEARERCRELLGELAAGSSVAVLDSGDEGRDVFLPTAEALGRIETLRTNPRASSLNRPVDRALRLLEQQEAGEETPPRLLYVFSDRTRACWDAGGLKPTVPAGVGVFFIDVGVDKPRDLGIEQVKVIPSVVPPRTGYEVHVRVRGTPGGHDNELSCRVEGDTGPPQRLPVKLGKDYTGDVLVFHRTAPEPPTTGPVDAPYQLTVRLATRDALPVNNVRHASFLVRRSRRLLTLVDDEAAKKKETIKLAEDRKVEVPSIARLWFVSHVAARSFACEVRPLSDTITAKQLSEYPVVCLFETARVSPEWWKKLADYVRAGGGLAIVPGGDEMVADVSDFNTGGFDKAGLLPAPLAKLTGAGTKPTYWGRFTREHPLMAPFAGGGLDLDFNRDELRPFVRRYWQVSKAQPAPQVIAHYDDPGKHAALLERNIGQGKVILFTSPLDLRQLDPDNINSPFWDNYIESSFGLVLIDRVCRYLGGEVTTPELNFRCGQVPQVALPVGAEGPFTLSGPGLAGAERNIKLPPQGGPVTLTQAVQPGNYLVLDAKNQPVIGFSLDVSPVETDLERLPIEQLENVLGKKSVVSVSSTSSLQSAIAGSARPPLELLPVLMMALLAVLTVESLLANRFYRRTPEDLAANAPTAT